MAEYTKLSPLDLQALVGKYNINGPVSVHPMEGGQANSSFKINTRDKAYILSVCDEKNPREIQTLVQILEHLRVHKFPTSRPLATRTGDKIITHMGKPVYLKEFIPGQLKKNLDSAMVYHLGEGLKHLHQIPVPDQLPHGFPHGLTAFENFLNKNHPHPFSHWLKDQWEFLGSRLDPTMPKGLIHGDVFWDNLIFDGNKLKAILDFEEACHYYLIFDLAMAAVGTCSREGKFDFNKVEALLRGYGGPLSCHQGEQLGVFLVYAATAGAFWRFCQYNIHHPDPQKKESYKELSPLADQIRSLAHYPWESI